MQGFFVMVDGLDGSGKGITVSAILEHLDKSDKKILDLRKYWKEENRIPEIEEIEEYDVIASAEPTFSMVGKVIREEIVRNNKRQYSGLSTAHAFSLDREILYKKLIIPAIEAGKIVVQERGVISSIVYQPVQLEKINLKNIIDLPGNRLALKYAPSLMIITKVDAEVIIERLKGREKKKDDAIFENLFFQRKIESRYESEWLKQLFTKVGSKVVYLDTNPPRTEEDTKELAIKIFKDHTTL